MNNHKILPFYMTYPMPLYYQEEDKVQRDLEYLQQMYPTEAKKYQKKIASILDRIDYDGSMIYDEYPDRLQIYRLAQDIIAQIKKEEEMQNMVQSGILPDITEGMTDTIQNFPGTMENGTNQPNPVVDDNPEKWEWIGDMVQILLFYEIYKRRHTNNRGILKF